MTESGSPTMWCPQCGAEYRPGFTRCADCQVDLVPEQPIPAPPLVVTGVEHELVEYDLAEMSNEQRDRLAALLQGAEIPFAWERPRRLVVEAAVADEVDEILDLVDASIAGDSIPPDDDMYRRSLTWTGLWEGQGIVTRLLTALGLIITVAAIVFGIWLQFDLPFFSGQGETYFRLTVALESLVPVGVGLLVVGAAQILAAMQTRTDQSDRESSGA